MTVDFYVIRQQYLRYPSKNVIEKKQSNCFNFEKKFIHLVFVFETNDEKDKYNMASVVGSSYLKWGVNSHIGIF